MDFIHGFKFASDTVKQILTLSTAILTLTVTFAKDYLMQKSRKVPWPLATSWICFLISVVGGVWALMALTGELGKDELASPTIWGANVIIPACVQCLSFLFGLVFTVWAGWCSVADTSASK
jgi:hypothetical protein